MMFRNKMSGLRISACCSKDFTIKDGNCTVEWVLGNLKHMSKIYYQGSGHRSQGKEAKRKSPKPKGTSNLREPKESTVKTKPPRWRD
jgi:hypothetical protein